MTSCHYRSAFLWPFLHCSFNVFTCLSKMCHFLLLRGGAPPFSMSLTTFSLATWKSFIVWITFYRDGFLRPENQKKNKQILKQLHVNLILADDSISGSASCRNVRLTYSFMNLWYKPRIFIWDKKNEPL